MATRPATAPEQMPIHGRLALHDPLDDHPGEARGRGRHVGDQHGHAGLQARGHGGAGVEAEPADPEQRGADQGQTMLWAGPVSLRLPSISAHIRPAMPELTCTTVPPAKSSTLRSRAGWTS